MKMNFFFIFFLVIQITLNANALKFSEIKATNNDLEEESFAQYEDTCVYISELPRLGMNKRNPTTDFLNLMHEKYSPEGLKVIGFLRGGYYLVKPEVYKFEMYVESSIDSLNKFLEQTDNKLTREDHFLIQRDGETVKNYKETTFNNKISGPTLFSTVQDDNTKQGSYELIKKKESNPLKRLFKKMRDFKSKSHLIGFFDGLFDDLFGKNIVKNIEKDIKNCLKSVKKTQDISISEKKVKEKQD